MNDLRIQRPTLRPISRTSTPVATPVITPSLYKNANTTPIQNVIIKKNTSKVNISTTEAPRSRSSTMTLENFETSTPSSRRSSVISLVNITGINSSRNLNNPPNYNPNFKVPKNNNKTRKNKQIINSYGPNFNKVKRNIYHYNNEVSNQKFLPIYQNYVKTKKQSNQNKVNTIQNWTKPTKRKWYDPRSWGKTKKLRR
jgi:hypothetical protein